METRKNTVKLSFARKDKVPSHLDVLRFVAKDLRLPASMVHSVYKDENEQCFFLKLMDKEAFSVFFERSDDQYPFRYADGQSTTITLEMASRQMKYVRLFNLPPETDDKEIEKAMSRFGKVRRHIRERYPVSSEYPVYSGIRGVHMEVEKEIPASLYVEHFRARVFYEGLRNKCFFCKVEGHMKSGCPKLAGIRNDFTVDDQGVEQCSENKQQNDGRNRLYSEITSGSKSGEQSITKPSLQKRNIESVEQQTAEQGTVSSPPVKKTYTDARNWNPITNDGEGDDLSLPSVESEDGQRCGEQNTIMTEPAAKSIAQLSKGRELNDENDTRQHEQDGVNELLQITLDSDDDGSREAISEDRGRNRAREKSKTRNSRSRSSSKRQDGEPNVDDDGFTVVKGKKKMTPLEALAERNRVLTLRARKK